MLGGLTPGNLSKIGGADMGASRVASAIENNQFGSGSNRVSQEDLGSQASPATKQRKNFAKSIQPNSIDKNATQLRHLTEIAPSAHHRFDKESVHLRTLYRKLYPSEAPKTNRNKSTSICYGAATGYETASGDSGADLTNRKSLLSSTGFPMGFQRRDTALPLGMQNFR